MHTHESDSNRDALVDRIARNWVTLNSPIRISAANRARYDAALRALALPAEAEGLLLGSTPELRTLAAEHGLRLTGADMDPVFWMAMSRACGRPDDPFILGDWFDLPAEPQWDVILGDGSLNMLPWPRMQAMFARLTRMLRPGATALFRLQAIDPDFDLAALEAAFDAWDGPRDTRAFFLGHHMLVESLRNAMHPEMTNRAFFDAVVGPLLTPAERVALRPLTRERRNCYPPLADLMTTIEAHFHIVDRQPCPESGTGATPFFFVLQVK